MTSKIDYQDVPSIQELPNGNWTIFWHGRVTRNPNVASEPLIEVYLRSHDSLEVIEVGVGQLPILKIGTFCKNKSLTNRLPDKFETFILKDIRITDESTKTITAWEKMDDTNYVIPPHHLKLPFSASSTNCLAINYNGDPYGIIVPASEIARFYYCQSTNLAHSAFWGEYDYDLDQIVNLAKTVFDEELDRLHVHLRQNFSDLDGWTIGRVLYDDTADKSVNRIHRSLLESIDTVDSGIFDCGIPFQGKTRWIAKGIQIGTKDNPRYLVLQLIKCSHPFPFSELQVGRDNDSSKADPETDKPTEEKRVYKRPDKDNQNKEEGQGSFNSESETHLNTPIVNIMSKTAQFDDIENKEIIKPDSKEYNEYKSSGIEPETPDITGLGTGQGDYSNSSTNQRAKIKRSKGVGADIEMLTEAVQTLSDQGMDIKIRGTYEMPLSAPAYKRQWAYLDSTSKTRRDVIIIDIKSKNKNYCWIEIEQRRKHECAVGLLCSQESMGDEVIFSILKNLSRLKGIWSGIKGNATDGSRINFEKVLHTWDSEAKLANTIKARLS